MKQLALITYYSIIRSKRFCQILSQWALAQLISWLFGKTYVEEVRILASCMDLFSMGLGWGRGMQNIGYIIVVYHLHKFLCNNKDG